MSEKKEYRFAVGNLVLSLVCHPAIFADFLADWFDVPSITQSPHMVFDFDIEPHNEMPFLPNSLLGTKIVNDDGSFDITDGLICGSYDPNTQHGHIKAKAILTKGLLPRVLEQLFYQIYYSGPKSIIQNSFLVHSSAVIADGGGYLFVGPSGAGKSTIASCSNAYQVINDEMNLIHLTPEGPVLEGTLFNGTYKEKRHGSAPLRAMFILDHQHHNKVSPAYLPDVVTALAAELVPILGLSETITRQTTPTLVDTAAKILDIVAARTLEFRPDPEFWPTILREFPPQA